LLSTLYAQWRNLTIKKRLKFGKDESISEFTLDLKYT
jgi:hypothetical protein